MQFTHDDLDAPGLCRDQRDALRALVGPGPFDARAAARAYLDAGHNWRDIPRAYQALVRVGRLPDVGLIWRIAAIAFREQPECNAELRRYATTLGPDTWREAADAAAAYAAADAAAAYAYAAYAAAYAADAAYAAARAAAYAADEATYTAAYAAAYDRIRDEIVEMVLAEVERVGALAAA